MDSFAKQQRAERAARSQFKVGTEVAVVSHHWDRRIVGKRKVVKVYATGNFTITDYKGEAGTQQWKPDWNGTSARQAGERSYSRSEHLEVWTDKHAAEIAARQEKRRTEKRMRAINEHLSTKEITPTMLDAIEALLGLTAPEKEPARESE